MSILDFSTICIVILFQVIATALANIKSCTRISVYPASQSDYEIAVSIQCSFFIICKASLCIACEISDGYFVKYSGSVDLRCQYQTFFGQYLMLYIMCLIKGYRDSMVEMLMQQNFNLFMITNICYMSTYIYVIYIQLTLY